MWRSAFMENNEKRVEEDSKKEGCINTKKYKKTKIILFAVVLVLILALGTGLVLSYDSETKSFELGRLAKNYKASDHKILYKGDTIVIYESNELYGTDDPAMIQKKIDKTLKIESLYLAAKKNGITVSDKEINTKLANDRKSAESAENYERDFKPLLEGMGVTADEYWNGEQLRELTKKLIAIEKLDTAQREILAKKKESDSSVDIEAEMTEWSDTVAQEQLDADHVKKVEP